MTDDVFTRLASTRILSLEGPPPEAVLSPEERSRALGSEAVAAYATDCRPIHEYLRRVIGQLAGLLILAQLTRKPLMAGLPELARRTRPIGWACCNRPRGSGGTRPYSTAPMLFWPCDENVL